jgi:hypothetical protein
MAVWIVGAAASARRTPPRCRTPHLAIWLEPTAGGTAGSFYYHLQFTNLSGHSCILRGFPSVSAVTLVGIRIGGAASRSAAKVQTIRLAQTKTASVVLRVVDTGNYPASHCHPVIAAGLRVYPPGDTVSKVIPFSFRACRSDAVAGLSVKAVTGTG